MKWISSFIRYKVKCEKNHSWSLIKNIRFVKTELYSDQIKLILTLTILIHFVREKQRFVKAKNQKVAKCLHCWRSFCC